MFDEDIEFNSFIKKRTFRNLQNYFSFFVYGYIKRNPFSDIH